MVNRDSAYAAQLVAVAPSSSTQSDVSLHCRSRTGEFSTENTALSKASAARSCVVRRHPAGNCSTMGRRVVLPGFRIAPPKQSVDVAGSPMGQSNRTRGPPPEPAELLPAEPLAPAVPSVSAPAEPKVPPVSAPPEPKVPPVSAPPEPKVPPVSAPAEPKVPPAFPPAEPPVTLPTVPPALVLVAVAPKPPLATCVPPALEPPPVSEPPFAPPPPPRDVVFSPFEGEPEHDASNIREPSTGIKPNLEIIPFLLSVASSFAATAANRDTPTAWRHPRLQHIVSATATWRR